MSDVGGIINKISNVLGLISGLFRRPLVIAVAVIAVLSSGIHFYRAVVLKSSIEESVTLKPSSFRVPADVTFKSSSKEGVAIKELKEVKVASKDVDKDSVKAIAKKSSEDSAIVKRAEEQAPISETEKNKGSLNADKNMMALKKIKSAEKEESEVSEGKNHFEAQESIGEERASGNLVGTAGQGSNRVCTSAEYRGNGFQNTIVDQKSWEEVMSLYHSIKADFAKWLDTNRKEIPDKTRTWMSVRMRALAIQRAPANEEPDLAWRGIGVYSDSTGNNPIVRLGGGYISLLRSTPKRAKFELTRLLAQSWAPCEFQKAGVQSIWKPLLKCAGLTSEQAITGGVGDSCGVGTYSESGWAVSSLLAVSLYNPWCDLPALKDAKVDKCIKPIPLLAWKE